MEDKIVEIARFYEPEEAQILESLLKSEGIKCYLRNEYTSQVMYPANMGGIRHGDNGSKRIRVPERR